MTNIIDMAISFVLKNEGGFTIDGGGPTNFGITAKYLMDNGRWQYDRNKNGVIDEEDMRNFTRDDAIVEYTLMFKEEGYDKINDPDLATRVFDMCVNSGPYEANLLLQRAFNTISKRNTLSEDGILGYMTLAFINNAEDKVGLLNQYRTVREDFYKGLAAKNPAKYDKDLNGWLKRAAL